MNRYYNNVTGRFLSADRLVASGRPADPASWNRYAYTRGDPIARYDPNGLDDQEPSDTPPYCYIGGLPVFNPLQCDPSPNGDCAPGNPWLCTTQPEPDTGPQPNSISTGNLPVTFYLNVLAGFQNAWNRLNQRPDCAKMFNPDGSHESPFATLLSTNYRVLPFPGDRFNVGAATVNPTTVFINSTGAFFNQNLYNPNTGHFDYADLGTGLTGSDWMALLLLHELGHQTGVLPPDSGPGTNPGQNGANTQKVLDNCFTALGGGRYM